MRSVTPASLLLSSARRTRRRPWSAPWPARRPTGRLDPMVQSGTSRTGTERPPGRPGSGLCMSRSLTWRWRSRGVRGPREPAQPPRIADYAVIGSPRNLRGPLNPPCRASTGAGHGSTVLLCRVWLLSSLAVPGRAWLYQVKGAGWRRRRIRPAGGASGAVLSRIRGAMGARESGVASVVDRLQRLQPITLGYERGQRASEQSRPPMQTSWAGRRRASAKRWT